MLLIESLGVIRFGCLTACFSRVAYDTCQRENGNSSWWIYNHGQCITNRSMADELQINGTIPPDQRVSGQSPFRPTSASQVSHHSVRPARLRSVTIPSDQRVSGQSPSRPTSASQVN